jgi:hypothetical protein
MKNKNRNRNTNTNTTPARAAMERFKQKAKNNLAASTFAAIEAGLDIDEGTLKKASFDVVETNNADEGVIESTSPVVFNVENHGPLIEVTQVIQDVSSEDQILNVTLAKEKEAKVKVDKDKVDKDKEENMAVGFALMSEAIIEIQQGNTYQADETPEGATVIQTGEGDAVKQDEIRKIAHTNKVMAEMLKCNEGNTKVNPDPDYVLYAQKVFRSKDIHVATIDDPVVGKVNVVTKGGIQWADNTKKMSFFSKDLLKSPNNVAFENELVMIALHAAKSKGWDTLNITVANERLADSIRSTAANLDFKGLNILVKKSSVQAHQEQDIEELKDAKGEVMGNPDLSEREKAEQIADIDKATDDFGSQDLII